MRWAIRVKDTQMLSLLSSCLGGSQGSPPCLSEVTLLMRRAKVLICFEVQGLLRPLLPGL